MTKGPVDKTWQYTVSNKGIMKPFKNLFEPTPTNMFHLVFYRPVPKFKIISNTAVNKALQILTSIDQLCE